MITGFNMPKSGTWEQRGGWVVKRLAADLGITLVQAAGLVGNVGFESGGFTKLHEIGQPAGVGGYGWGQWTSNRRRTFLAFCTQNALDWQSDEANYGYLLHELQGEYASTVHTLKQAATLERAVMSVGETYERPAGTTVDYLPGYDERLDYGRRALAAAQPAIVTPTADVTLADVIATARHLQTQLTLLGYYSGAIDGAIGSASSAAAMKAWADWKAKGNG